jgi:hypothetical protein
MRCTKCGAPRVSATDACPHCGFDENSSKRPPGPFRERWLETIQRWPGLSPQLLAAVVVMSSAILAALVGLAVGAAATTFSEAGDDSIILTSFGLVLALITLGPEAAEDYGL